MEKVNELDYLYITEALLRIQKCHCLLRDRYEFTDKEELRKLMGVYADILESYAASIYCDDSWVPNMKSSDFFARQGLVVSNE